MPHSSMKRRTILAIILGFLLLNLTVTRCTQATDSPKEEQRDG